MIEPRKSETYNFEADPENKLNCILPFAYLKSFLDSIGHMQAFNVDSGYLNFYFEIYNVTYDGPRDSGFIFGFYKPAFVKNAY